MAQSLPPHPDVRPAGTTPRAGLGDAVEWLQTGRFVPVLVTARRASCEGRARLAPRVRARARARHDRRRSRSPRRTRGPDDDPGELPAPSRSARGVVA